MNSTNQTRVVLAGVVAIVLLVPVAANAWERYGLASFWLPVSLAVLV